MKKYIDQIDALPDWQKMTAVGLVILLTVALFYFLVYDPKSKEIEGLKKEIIQLDAQINKGLAMKDKQRQLEKEVAMLNEQLKLTVDILPDRTAMDQLVRSIESLAVECGLTVDAFKPRPEISLDFYGEKPVELALTGGFHELGKFFEKLANESRIVNISSLRIQATRQVDPSITVNIGSKAFWFLKETTAP